MRQACERPKPSRPGFWTTAVDLKAGIQRVVAKLPAWDVRKVWASLPRGQVIVEQSNRRWATDLTTVWTREAGLAAIVPMVECGDRVALACGVSKSQEAVVVLHPGRW